MLIKKIEVLFLFKFFNGLLFRIFLVEDNRSLLKKKVLCLVKFGKQIKFGQIGFII